MPGPTGFALERFVRPRESARGRTNRASATAQLAVRARAARPYARPLRRRVSDVRSRPLLAVLWDADPFLPRRTFVVTRHIPFWICQAGSPARVGKDVERFVCLHAEPSWALVEVARRALLVRHLERSVGAHSSCPFSSGTCSAASSSHFL